MGIEIGLGEFERKLRSFERGVIERAPVDLQRVGEEALERARGSLAAGVYATAPGRYRRTGELLARLRKLALSSGDIHTVVIGDDAPYASFIEYGILGSAVGPDVVRRLAEDIGTGAGVVTLGRSGARWMVPQPFIFSSAVFADLRMGELLERSTLNAWRANA